MSRYYDKLSDDGRRCIRCNRSCQIFGSIDVVSGWEGYCKVCNKLWYVWYMNTDIRLCDRGCRDKGLFHILRSRASVEITTKFVLGQCPEEVAMACSLKHLFALVQLSWLSCPLEWWYEDTDSSAEEERYQRPILRTLREVSVVCPSHKYIERPRLLDLVCMYLYCDQAQKSVGRPAGAIPSAAALTLRIAQNGKAYSWPEFQDWYKDAALRCWDEAAILTTLPESACQDNSFMHKLANDPNPVAAHILLRTLAGTQ